MKLTKTIPMKPFTCFFGITLMLATIQPSQADLEWNPMTLEKRGKFIELQPGDFIRASSVVRISGDIRVSARLKSPGSGHALAIRRFPLSPKGIEELHATAVAALTHEFGLSADQADDLEYDVNVGVEVNGYAMDLLLMTGGNPQKSWDDLERKLKAAAGNFDKLLLLASEVETAPSAGDKPEH